RQIQDRRVVHSDLAAEATVSQVWPVTDFTIANSHQIREAVSGHVGKEDRVRGVVEDEFGSERLIRSHLHRLARPETFFRKRWAPGDDVVLSDQNVRVSVAGEVDESQVGIIPFDIELARERSECGPAPSTVAFEESGVRAVELDEVEESVAGEVEELNPTFET